jgi:hypothetical protein
MKPVSMPDVDLRCLSSDRLNGGPPSKGQLNNPIAKSECHGNVESYLPRIWLFRSGPRLNHEVHLEGASGV